MKSRVLTAIGLIPFVLGAFFCASPLPISLLAIVAGAIGISELTKLLKTPAAWLGLLWPVLFYFSMGPSLGGGFLLPFYFVGVFAAWQASTDTKAAPYIAPFASLWLLIPLISLVMLHGTAHTSQTWNFTTPILLAVLPLWGGDTAAIFAGKAFGTHPLAPKISPKKTVEGAFANLIACIAVAAIVANAIGQTWTTGIICGVITGTLGQAGDLFESALKRTAGVKDSGTLLPGHGGILDRIDSILFTAPLVWLVIMLVK